MTLERNASLPKSLLAILCAITLVPGDTLASPAQLSPAPPQSPSGQTAKLPADLMDSLVAPIALYPDPLLAQVLAASTYPLEIVLLQRWLDQNKHLKDKALADAVAKQNWDQSVEALAAVPEVAKFLSDNIQWTTDLGNAFLAQQNDLMDAVQRMRKKAKDKGTLQTTSQQTVETQVIENKSVVVIEPSNPQVLYVPAYDPAAVYGPPVYPYPSITYPSWGYYAAGAAISFGVGLMMGAWWSGGWGWGCGWGGGNVYVNHYNNFNRNTIAGAGGVRRPGGVGGVGRPGGVGGIGGVGGPGGVGGVGGIGGVGRPGGVGGIGGIGGPGGVGGVGGVGGIGKPGGVGGIGGNRPSTLPSGVGNNGLSNWAHNPAHRGGTPYPDRATANRFGGTARGDSLAQRQAGARQQIARQGGNLMSRPAASANFGRPGGAAGLGNRAGSIGAANRTAPGIGAGGADRIGGRDLSRRGAADRGGAFGGGSRGFNGSNALGNSNRGRSSAGSLNRGSGGGFRHGGFNRGGGSFRGGGFRGGGFRGGGGGRRGGGRRR